MRPGNAGSSSSPPPHSDGHQITTFAYEGRFWDVFVEFEDDPRRPDSCRARLCFVPADRSESEEPVRTALILIEPSWEDAIRKAEALEAHQLGAFLRSASP